MVGGTTECWRCEPPACTAGLFRAPILIGSLTSKFSRSTSAIHLLLLSWGIWEHAPWEILKISLSENVFIQFLTPSLPLATAQHCIVLPLAEVYESNIRVKYIPVHSFNSVDK